MSPCPWKKPRQAEATQMHSTAGPSAKIEYHAFGMDMTSVASHFGKSIMTPVPRKPMMR